MIKRILIIFWNILISVILVEIVFAIFQPAPRFHKIHVTCEGDYMLTPNRKLVYIPRPHIGRFNERGYRGKVFPFKKKNNVKRIVFLGDSVVEGFQIAPEKRFTELLDNLLGEKYEILNLGVQGYNLRQEVEYLKIAGIDYQPDYVIFGICFNDRYMRSGQLEFFSKKISDLKKNKVYNFHYSVKDGFEVCLLKFNLYRYFKYFIFNIAHNNENMTLTDNLYSSYMDDVEVRKILYELDGLSKEYNFKVAFVILPFNLKGSDENVACRDMNGLKELFPEMNFPHLDLYEHVKTTMGDKGNKELYLGNDPCHLNEEGHIFIANLLYKKFDKLVPNYSKLTAVSR